MKRPGTSFGRSGPAARRGRRAPAASAREAACRALIEQATRFPDLLPLEPETAGLEGRDAALAQAIYDAVVRRWLTLSAIVEHALGRPMGIIEPALRAVLLAGAAQLVLMDRIPDHAAVDESVELAKALVRPKAAGLVNAGLRKVAALRAGVSEPGADPIGRDRVPLADGRVLMLRASALPAGELALLSAATSHPSWLLERWAGRWPAERVRALAMHGLVHAPTVLNTAFARAALPKTLVPHRSPGSHVFSGSRSELLEMLGSRGDVWVQDAASSRAVASASSLRPSLILDLCAGQGTKTRQLAATFPDARIVATDTDPARLRTLASVFRGSAQVEVAPIRDLVPRLTGRADLVLLDVPCSNTGVLARRPEAKYRCSGVQLERLTGIQRQIVADAIPLVTGSPRGRILYSTCSLEQEEDEAQAAWAGRQHRFKLEREERALPEGEPGGDAAAYCDGSYSAVLA